MQVKKLDATPYLMAGEKVELKISAKNNRFNLIQTILCYAFWLIVLAGDCFLIGMTSTWSEGIDNVNSFVLPIIITLLVLHIVPFAFWLVSILQSKQKSDSKWYAVTNKRILVISGNNPVIVSFINLDDITSFKVNKDSINLAFGEERVTLYDLPDPSLIANKITAIFENADDNELPNAEFAETTESEENDGE